MLFIYQKLGKLKGSIELVNIKAIEPLDMDVFSQEFVLQVRLLALIFITCSELYSNLKYKTTLTKAILFQIIYDEGGSDWSLYVVAKSSNQQMKWIKTLQNGTVYIYLIGRIFCNLNIQT